MMSYPEFSSWKQRESCECIKKRLKTLSIKGFEEDKIEVEFLEYIITTVEVMEKITIWFVDDCSWSQATRAIYMFAIIKCISKLLYDFQAWAIVHGKWG